MEKIEHGYLYRRKTSQKHKAKLKTIDSSITKLEKKHLNLIQKQVAYLENVEMTFFKYIRQIFYVVLMHFYFNNFLLLEHVKSEDTDKLKQK